MNTAGLYHRPDSEYAYLYDDGHFHIRLRTKAGEIESVKLVSGDNYAYDPEEWLEEEKNMHLLYRTSVHDYWVIDTYALHSRLAYSFHLTDYSGIEVLYTDRGVYPFEEHYMENINSFFRMPYFHDIDN